MNAHPIYRNDPCHPPKVLMIARLVHRNSRSVPWANEEALALLGEQGSTSHDISPRTSKSSSPPEGQDSRILRGYYGAKGIGDPGPFHIKPVAHAEEEEMSKDEQRKSRPPGYAAEDNPVLGEPRSRKGEVPRHQGESPRGFQWKAQAPWASHRGMVEKQSQERPPPLH